MLRRPGRGHSRQVARSVLRTRLLLQFAELPMANAATSARPAAAHLLLLGEPRLLLADGSAHALERKDAALLALLAVDGATPRWRLVTGMERLSDRLKIGARVTG